MGEIQLIGLIILIIGILFMIAEIFVPSFGITGGIGFLAMTIGIILTAETFTQGVVYFFIMLVISVIFLILGYHFIGNSKLTLKANLNEDEKPNYQALIGLQGKTLSILRPAGIAEINGNRFDVMSQGEFINKNEAIKVIAVENNNIIVGRV